MKHLIVTVPKPGINPKLEFDPPIVGPSEEREMTAEEAAEFVAWTHRRNNCRQTINIANNWPITLRYVNVYDSRKAPTITKGGIEYLLFVLPYCRTDGCNESEVESWADEMEVSQQWSVLEDTHMLRNGAIIEYLESLGYEFPTEEVS